MTVDYARFGLPVDHEAQALEAALAGVPVDVPKGALDLGCRNCRVIDRIITGERILYCAQCPVTGRRREA